MGVAEWILNIGCRLWMLSLIWSLLRKCQIWQLFDFQGKLSLWHNKWKQKQNGERENWRTLRMWCSLFEQQQRQRQRRRDDDNNNNSGAENRSDANCSLVPDTASELTLSLSLSLIQQTRGNSKSLSHWAPLSSFALHDKREKEIQREREEEKEKWRKRKIKKEKLSKAAVSHSDTQIEKGGEENQRGEH